MFGKKIHLSKKAKANWTFEKFKEKLAPVFASVRSKDREKVMKEQYKELTGRDPDRQVDIEVEQVSEESGKEPPKRGRKKRSGDSRSNNE